MKTMRYWILFFLALMIILQACRKEKAVDDTPLIIPLVRTQGTLFVTISIIRRGLWTTVPLLASRETDLPYSGGNKGSSVRNDPRKRQKSRITDSLSDHRRQSSGPI